MVLVSKTNVSREHQYREFSRTYEIHTMNPRYWHLRNFLCTHPHISYLIIKMHQEKSYSKSHHFQLFKNNTMKLPLSTFKAAILASIVFNTAFAFAQVYNHNHPPELSLLTTSASAFASTSTSTASSIQPTVTKITMSSLASNSYLSASNSTGSYYSSGSHYSSNEEAPRTPHRPQNRITNVSSTDDSEAEYDTLVERVRSWQLDKLRSPQKRGADTDSGSEEYESDTEESEDEEEGGVSIFVRDDADSDSDCDSEGYEADDEGGEWDLEGGDGDEIFVWIDSDGEEVHYRATVGEDGGEENDIEVGEGSDEEEAGEDEDKSGSEGGESAVTGDKPPTTAKASVKLVGEEEALDEDSADERYRWRNTDRARLVAFRRQRMMGMRDFEMY